MIKSHQSINKRPSSVKWVYCPQYNKFLRSSKPKLKERIKSHLIERETALFTASTQTINNLNDICKDMAPIPIYSQSLVNHQKITNLINNLVDEWEGPIYGNRLIKELHGNETNVEVIDDKKFTDRAINWMQQTSHRVNGPFFAKHIINIKEHLIKHYPANIINYGCLKLAVELLNREIKLYRSGRKPLIRYTTLRDNVNIQSAFKKLHHSLDVVSLKRNLKSLNKNTGKHALTAQTFTKYFKQLCNDLLSKEKSKIKSCNFNTRNDVISFKFEKTRDRTYMNGYSGNRGVSYRARNYRHNPSIGYVDNMSSNNGIVLPQILKDTICNGEGKMKLDQRKGGNNVQLYNDIGMMNTFNMMNGTSICSACCQALDKVEINGKGGLCEKCERVLNEINTMDYDVVMKLVIRSRPYAQAIAARFCSQK